MTEHPNEDVAVVREALELLPEMPDSELNPEGEEQARESKRLVAQEGRAALDRLQARLEAAEAIARHEERESKSHLAELHKWEELAEQRAMYAHEQAAAISALRAERDEARADAERLAARLEDALTQVECKGWCADAGCPFCGGFLRPARAALAAHEPHLTGPTHKPIGTFYTTEDAVEPLYTTLDFDKGTVTPGSYKPQFLPSQPPDSGGAVDRPAGSSSRVRSDGPPNDSPDDVGPPAPGEGDDLPNPEVGMKC